MTTTIDYDALLSQRVRDIDVSGIRRVFELGAKLANPINLSIGQPDFPVPDPIKQATIDAIEKDRNGYTLTQGAPDLLRAIGAHLKEDVGWDVSRDEFGTMVTSGTSGGLMLAFLAMLEPGVEAIIPDPWFVIYPVLGPMSGGTIVPCDTYPDCRMTAARVEPLITERTRCVLVNSPGNPSGVVMTETEMNDLADLCEARGIVLISDEIYDVFTYDDARENGHCPSPARRSESVLLIRGFGKTYGCTGWRLGYAAGPSTIITQMMKLQQYTYVCAPSMAQAGVTAAFGVDMTDAVQSYQHKRDMMLAAFDGITEVVRPGGAFYGFVKVPERLGVTATEFVERAIEQNVLVIPGAVFSDRDTHFRISFATSDKTLAAGLEVLASLMA